MVQSVPNEARTQKGSPDRGLLQLAYLRNPECPAFSQDFTYELGATGVATHSEPRLVGQPLAEIQNPSGAETAKVERASLERP